MSSLPTPEDAARLILDVFVRFNTRPGEGLQIGSFIRPFSTGGFRVSDFDDGAKYAEEQGWIEVKSSTFVGLTESGFDEAQQKPPQPSRAPQGNHPASQGHRPQTVINIGAMHNSPFQNIGAGASGVQNTDYQISGADLRAIIDLYRENVDGLNLSQEDRRRADKQIKTIEHQIEDDEPDQSIVRQAGKTLKTIVQGAIGGALGNAISNPGVWTPLLNLFS